MRLAFGFLFILVLVLFAALFGIPIIDQRMGNVFAPEKPLKEVIRENQRMIKKSIRELEKEIRSLETNQKKLEADIKKHAKMNQMVHLIRSFNPFCHCLINCSLLLPLSREQSRSWPRITFALRTILQNLLK